MTDARVETTYEDRETARELLVQAEIFLADAERSENANESRAVLTHNAVIAMCDAVLAADGFRVTSGDRAHVLRIETALERLPGDMEELAERLDAVRERRNEASYSGLPVADASVDDALDAAAELIELARAHVA